MQGFLNQTWLTAQSQEKSQNPNTTQQQWFCHILQGIWKFHNKMWQNRNEILHSSAPTAKCITESSINAQVHKMYQSQQELLQLINNFSLPLAHCLHAKFWTKTYWWKLARRYYSTTWKKQYSWTHSYPKIRHAPMSSGKPAGPNEATIQSRLRQTTLPCPPIWHLSSSPSHRP